MDFILGLIIGIVVGAIGGICIYAINRYKKTKHPGHLYISDDQQFYLELEEELKYESGTYVVFDIRHLELNKGDKK